jgi:hypothetical protein
MAAFVPQDDGDMLRPDVGRHALFAGAAILAEYVIVERWLIEADWQIDVSGGKWYGRRDARRLQRGQ